MTQAVGLVFALNCVDIAVSSVEGREFEEKENLQPKYNTLHEKYNTRLPHHQSPLSDPSPLSSVFNNISRSHPRSFQSYKSLKRSSSLIHSCPSPDSRTSPTGAPFSAKRVKIIILSKGDQLGDTSFQDEVMKIEEPSSSENSNPPSPIGDSCPPFRSYTDGNLPSLVQESDEIHKFPARSASVPLSVILNPRHSTNDSSNAIHFPFPTVKSVGSNGNLIKTKVVSQIKRTNQEIRKPSPSTPSSSSSPSLSSSELKKTLQSSECLDSLTTNPSQYFNPRLVTSSLEQRSFDSGTMSNFTINHPRNGTLMKEGFQATPYSHTPTLSLPPPPTGRVPFASEQPGTHVLHLAPSKFQSEMVNFTEPIRSKREDLLMYENVYPGLQVQGNKHPSPHGLNSRPLPCTAQIRAFDCKTTNSNVQPSLVDRTEKLTSYCSGNLKIRMVAGGISKQHTSQKKAFVYQFQ